MFAFPIQRRKCFAFEDQAQRQASTGILATPDPGPHGEVVDKLKEFKVLTISNDGAQDFAHKAALHTVALFKFLFLTVFVWDHALSTEPSGVGSSFDSFTHVVAEVERGP